MKRLALRATKIGAVGTPSTQLIGMAGVAVVLAVAMAEVQHGLMTMGDFVTFLTAMLLMMPPLRRISGLNATIVTMTVAAQSIFATLDEAEEADTGTTILANVKGNVVFEHVSMRYPGADHDAVTDFNLTVAPGETVALVGTSGSGKSTLVNLLPRFWNPTAGRILMDGVDTQTVTLASLRKQIAVVSQDVMLFDGTIRENLIYGTPDATEEAVEAAIEAAALKDFVASLPVGLNTPVGEAGNKLSGGQKQRISIARALLKNAPLLILDEATSALDAESEQAVKTALAHLMKGRTTFMVAHRLATVENADQIVAYPETTREAIKGVTLSVRPGEHVALVGLSGSGKSSMVNLVPRFWSVTSGAVMVDGVNVEDCTLTSLRNHIAVVSQNVILFDTTIRENIAYGMPEASEAAIEKAVEAAALTEVVAALPKGLDTPVGEAGGLLSGGQKQRISIARALLKDAPILILDEATSALDSESENQIKEALETLMRGRTCLTVAHRLSTIDRADRIVVMSDGKIVEEGTPAELLARGGAYARMVRLQTGIDMNA